MLQRELMILTHQRFRQHPNIVRLLLYDLVEDGDEVITPALVMERARYGNLSTFLARNYESLIETEKVDICWDVTSGLSVLHQYGVVHGDVKTDNVLIFESPEPGRRFTAKLTDFGSCIFLEDTRSARYFGTRTTNAPETVDQSGDRAIPPAMLPCCDIYSLGLIFLHIVSRNLDEFWTSKEPTVLESALLYINASALSFNLQTIFRSSLSLLLQWDPYKRCRDLSVVLDILKPYRLNDDDRYFPPGF